MRRIGQLPRHRPEGGVVLAILLVATLVAPLAGALRGSSIEPPFDLSRDTLAAIAAAAALVHALAGARRAGWAGVRRSVAISTLTGLVALVLQGLITLRASGFYTEEALFEGVAVLLGLHTIAVAMRAAGHATSTDHPRTARHGFLRRLRTRSEDAPVTAAAFADSVTDGVAMLVLAFWVLTALNARDVAFTLMLVAGASELLVLVLRLPDALRALERWMKPAASKAE